MTLNVLIVDDEPVARRRLRRLLRAHHDVGIAGECGDGASAVEMVRAQTPDVVLLDVQMPELDGFEVLRELSSAPMPQIVFVTAHDQYALRAFEVHALDYLLKPIQADRLALAIDRVRARLSERRQQPDQRIVALLETLAPAPKRPERIPVRSGERLLMIDLRDVDWIGAADNYVVLHTGSKQHVLRETMNKLEQQLDPERFVRIHRSTIVQIDRIRELIPDFHGDMVVVLKDGARLTLSRGNKRKLEAMLGWNL
jgi:two-component system, LytTR family, response regulator